MKLEELHFRRTELKELEEFKLPERVTIPSGCGSVLRYLLQKSGLSRAMNTTYPRKYPAV